MHLVEIGILERGRLSVDYVVVLGIEGAQNLALEFGVE